MRLGNRDQTQEELGLMLEHFQKSKESIFDHPVNVVRRVSRRFAAMTEQQITYRLKQLINAGYLINLSDNGRITRVELSEKGKQTQSFFVNALLEANFHHGTEQGATEMSKNPSEHDPRVMSADASDTDEMVMTSTTLANQFSTFLDFLSSVHGESDNMRDRIHDAITLYLKWREKREQAGMKVSPISSELMDLKNFDWQTVMDLMRDWTASLEALTGAIEKLSQLKVSVEQAIHGQQEA